MKVLIVEPGKYPREADIERTVEAFENIIGGETVGYDNGKGACFFKCKPGNEEELPINRVLSENDVIRGTFIISGMGKKEPVNLSPRLMKIYEKVFHDPLFFVEVGDTLYVKRVTPEEYTSLMNPSKPLKQPKRDEAER